MIVAMMKLVTPNAVLAHAAGMVLKFGLAFGIVMLGSIIGMTMQYWAARCLFKAKVPQMQLPAQCMSSALHT